MGLKDILQEIDDKKKVISQDLSQVNIRARTYKVGQINSAKERLETLYVNYKNELLNNSVFILATGKNAQKFVEVGVKDFGCFAMDAKQLYKDIAEEISPQLYLNKTISSSVFDVINNVIETKMQMLDVISYNTVLFSVKYQRVVKSKEEFIDVIKDAMNDEIGSEAVGLYALENISKKAVNEGYKSRLVPIILHTDDESLIEEINKNIRKTTPRAVIVTAGKTKTSFDSPILLDKATKAGVEEALKQIAANA